MFFDTEALCHLSVTDVKKNIWKCLIFCKNEACVNSDELNQSANIS